MLLLRPYKKKKKMNLLNFQDTDALRLRIHNAVLSKKIF